MEVTDITAKAAALMPSILSDLERLVEIPSIAFPGYPPEPVQQMATTTRELFRRVGFTDAELMDVPDGYPPLYGEIAGPPVRRWCCCTPTTTCSRPHSNIGGRRTPGPRRGGPTDGSTVAVRPTTRGVSRSTSGHWESTTVRRRAP